jgi:hypothetical protein
MIASAKHMFFLLTVFLTTVTVAVAFQQYSLVLSLLDSFRQLLFAGDASPR